ncbi:1-aminocyclopropane-1-carboxylate oxidase homolog 1 [Linum perenne]
MATTSAADHSPNTYDRLADLKSFDETKAGVKGLVDSGITHVPRIFHNPPNPNIAPPPPLSPSGDPLLRPPVIDFAGIGNDKNMRKAVVEGIRDAAGEWGFFQVVNHGVPARVTAEMAAGVVRFFEMEVAEKRVFFSRDFVGKKVRYNSNYDLYTSKAASWRDSIGFEMGPVPPNPDEFPGCCREIVMEYADEMKKLGDLLLSILSEALGLDPNHLAELECAKGLTVVGHYYPPCPEPELTMGTRMHQDDSFFTVLQQDHIGGLQVLHNDQLVDLAPTPGALVVNIGNLLQFISSEHRVLANRVGPRVSIGSFFSTDNVLSNPRMYEPIKELISENDRPKYKKVSVQDYQAKFHSEGLNGTSALLHFQL